MQKSESGQFLFQGCSFAYKLRGSSSDTSSPVVLIQGTGTHGDAWNPQVEQLQEEYRCLTFDNRGMAGSQPLAVERLSVSQLADDTLALMDHLGWNSVHLVGHSLGGLIAQSVALKATQRIRSLSLLCTFSRGRDATKLSWPMLWTGLRTFVGTRRMRRRAFCEIVLPPQLWPQRDQWLDRLAEIFGHDLAEQPPVVMKQLAAMKAYDATPELPKINHIPTLVVGANFDMISTPSVAKRLADSFPGCHFVQFEHAAHGVTVQLATEINQLLTDHFSRADKIADA